jgi:hypothetical protein
MTVKPLPNHSAPHRRIHLRAGHFTAIDFTLGLFEFGGCIGWHRFEYRDNGPNAKGADPSNLDSSKGIVNLADGVSIPSGDSSLSTGDKRIEKASDKPTIEDFDHWNHAGGDDSCGLQDLD